MPGKWWLSYGFIMTMLLILSMAALAFAAHLGGAF